MIITTDLVYFCAAECERQHSGEMSVARMIEAWTKAPGGIPIGIDHVLMLAKLIEPDVNKNGFRKIPVIFAGGGSGLNHELIPSALDNLLAAQFDLSPVEFYTEFQKIHPFADGNGRVGAILFQWRNGTLYDNFIVPPDVFSEET